jgi:hypothetical protein
MVRFRPGYSRYKKGSVLNTDFLSPSPAHSMKNSY